MTLRRPNGKRPHPLRTATPSIFVWAMALISGAYLLAMALRSPDVCWLAWISLLPVFAGVRVLRPLRALSAGALWGFALFLFCSTGASATARAGLPALALLVTVPAAYMCLGATVTARLGFNVLLLAVGWMGVELALQPLDLPNGLLACVQGNGAVMHLVGGLLGYGLVAVFVALVNAILLSVVISIRPSLFRLRSGWIAHRIGFRRRRCEWLRFEDSAIVLPDARGPPSLGLWCRARFWNRAQRRVGAVTGGFG